MAIAPDLTARAVRPVSLLAMTLASGAITH